MSDGHLYNLDSRATPYSGFFGINKGRQIAKLITSVYGYFKCAPSPAPNRDMLFDYIDPRRAEAHIPNAGFSKKELLSQSRETLPRIVKPLAHLVYHNAPDYLAQQFAVASSLIRTDESVDALFEKMGISDEQQHVIKDKVNAFVAVCLSDIMNRVGMTSLVKEKIRQDRAEVLGNASEIMSEVYAHIDPLYMQEISDMVDIGGAVMTDAAILSAIFPEPDATTQKYLDRHNRRHAAPPSQQPRRP